MPPNRPKDTGCWRSILGIAIAGWLLVALSCNEDATEPCPCYRVGIVEGYVLEGGQRASVEVGARSVSGENQGYLVGTTHTDAHGWYSLTLPSGAYHLEINPYPLTLFTPAYLEDSIHVEAHARRLDLRRGKLIARVGVPRALNGRTFHAELERGLGGDPSCQAEAEAGWVEFVFSVLEPDTYRLGLSHAGRPLWLPGTEDRAAADTVAVTLDTPADYECAFSDYASIAGTIQGSWQAASVASPWITAFDEEGEEIAWTWADDEGAFSLDFLIARSVKLRVEVGGLEQWIGGDSFTTARTYNLPLGDHVADVKWVESGLLCWLDGPGNLTCHRPAVRVRCEDGSEVRPGVSGDPNPIRICNLCPGRYYVYVYSDYQTWAGQWFDGADTFSEATPIDLTEGELRELVFHLRDADATGGEAW